MSISSHVYWLHVNSSPAFPHRASAITKERRRTEAAYGWKSGKKKTPLTFKWPLDLWSCSLSLISHSLPLLFSPFLLIFSSLFYHTRSFSFDLLFLLLPPSGDVSPYNSSVNKHTRMSQFWSLKQITCCIQNRKTIKSYRQETTTRQWFFFPSWQDKKIPTCTGFPLQRLPNKPHHQTLFHTPQPPTAALSEDPRSGGSIIRTILITCSHFSPEIEANVERLQDTVAWGRCVEHWRNPSRLWPCEIQTWGLKWTDGSLQYYYTTVST